MYHILFRHSSVNGHLGCFHLLAIGNNAAVNMVYKYLSPCFQLFGCTGVELFFGGGG